MSQQYQNHAAFELSNLHSPASLSGTPSHGLPQEHPPSAQTLPPVSNASYGPASGAYTYAPQNPAMMMTSHSETVSRARVSFTSVYGPTAHALYPIFPDNNVGSYADLSQRQQQTQTSRPSSTHMQPQPQAPPAYTAVARSLPEIAPMPPRTIGAQVTAFGNSNINDTQSEQQTLHTHVVGAQGRRGILPSGPGRPAALVGADSQASKNIPLPPKNDEGKYPCPHCEKTYLHSKHLKRHLLRHTGTRPYSCGLCTDTFSRSDILKRHFQKCSSRRGNPTGQNHLAHSRANKQWREQKEQQDRQSMESGTPTISDIPGHPQMPSYTPTSADASFDLTNLNLSQSNYGERSNQVSRANSVTRSGRSTGSQSNRASLGMVPTTGYESVGYAHSAGHVTPDSITTSGAATPYTYPHEPRTSQLPGHEQFSHTANGDLAFNASSRPPTSSSYNHTSLPHIVGQGHNREYNTDWSPYSLGSHDELGNGQHHSGTTTPFEREKPTADTGPLFAHYQPYHGPKV